LLSAKKIPAGSGGQIEVSVKTDNLFGPIEKLVNVRTNDPRHSVVTLSIRAVVDPEVRLSAQNIDFGNTPAGKDISQEVILTIATRKPVKILSAESNDSAVSVKLEPLPGSSGKAYKLKAVQKANARPGYHFGRILVKTDSRLSPSIAIFERGVIAGAGK
jgi:hypothetical protein